MTEEQVFLAALDLDDPVARASYLKKACGGDVAFRRQVEELLAAHFKTGEFLDESVGKQIGAGSSIPMNDNTVDLHRKLGGDAVAEQKKSAEEPDDLHFLKPSSRPDSLGRIGHYEVLQILGKGGFGIVFRAFDEVLQRVVALKVLAPAIAATSPARKRFLREARSSAKVRHENVVQVYAVEEQPLPYLVMEFIPGETLQQLLDRTGPLDVADILQIGRQIAEGLAAAHATNLIHRDIKPGNVLLEGGQQRVKITDFGLARAADDASLTQSGVLAGTPMYMAPEQAQGETLDHRADLFSLGSVLYVMATGRPPFRASTTYAVMKRVVEDDPRPIREVIPEMPQWFCDVIAKLHAKKPEDRFQSAREVADVLADCEVQLKSNTKLKDFSRIPSSKPAAKRSGRWKWVAATALLLPVLALTLLLTENAGITQLFRGGGTTPDAGKPGSGPAPIEVVKQPAPLAHGTVRIESDDPDLEIVFDKNGPTSKGTDKNPIPLKIGAHAILIKRGDFTFETDKLLIEKDKTSTLKIALFQGKMQLVLDGKVLGEKEIPPATAFTNSIGMKFVLVLKGKFFMGGVDGKVGDKEVNIPHDFYLGKYEVTQEEWFKVMKTTPSFFSRTGEGSNKVADIDEKVLKQFPVERVSWFDAQEFVAKLNELENPKGWKYRLPTEAEWEYGCRGGPLSNKTDYGFDYYFNQPTNMLVPEHANYAHEKGLGRTCPVGSYPPNQLGLFDMHGNVFEWCDDAPKAKEQPTDRVARGGSWSYGSSLCKAGLHNVTPGGPNDHNFGLRLARVPV